ncbi:MAG: cyclic nucleotide-binding domain-containing protein, partial [Oscillospiraceae bacterium]|nr:cyclic nucleotide-binding domain-containing protein [Oscillospiraceae bacterium]
MADIALLKQLGKVVNFTENQTVFMQDDEGDNMYIVLKGTFGVYINSFSSFPVRIAEVQQGSFFGEMSVIDGWPRSATIVAEVDGAALAVDMSNFSLLLEKAPDIAESILNTLRNRALNTAAAVAESGKTAPEMPQALKTAKYQDAKSSISFMTMLAERVRDMNAMLATQEEAQPPPEAKGEQKEESLELLPDGYVPFNIRDENDNRAMLHVKKYICPYCNKETQAAIPVFSALKPQSATLDGRIIYKGFDILRYTNNICRKCN